MALRKTVKPLSQDTAASDQPPESPYYAKNAINMEKIGTWYNEPGFIPSSIQFPNGYTVIGVVPTDRRVIFFLTNNVSSEIGAYDPKTDTYRTIVNDVKFGFNTQKYITGRYRYNFQNQLIVAFTDDFNIPYTINIDSPADAVARFEQYSLFPIASAPTFHPVSTGALVVPGGALLSGVYFILVRYRNNDYSETNFEISSQPISVPGTNGYGAPAGTVTDWKIQMTLDNVDTSYDKIVIGLYQIIGGVASFNEVKEIQIPPSTTPLINGVSVIITGSETLTPLLLGEALIDTSWYDKVRTMTDLNDVLYIANLYRKPSYLYQSIANNITVKYISRFTDFSKGGGFGDAGLNYNTSSFRHNEVYALYVAFHYRKGGYTRAFHIPGRPPQPSDLAPSYGLNTGSGIVTNPFIQPQYNSAASSRYNGSIPTFQVEDTSTAFPSHTTNFITGLPEFRGQLGYWENADELYPNDPATWGALAGQPVRHHRFPSLRRMGLHYQNNGGAAGPYGKTILDALGVEIDNVVIPPELAAVVDGYQIYYAKRTLANSLVIASSLYMTGTPTTPPSSIQGNFNFLTGQYNSTQGPPGRTVIRSTGTNSGITSLDSSADPATPQTTDGVVNYEMIWLAGNNAQRGDDGFTDPMYVDYRYMRFHSFDLLSQKSPIAVTPDYIWNDLVYSWDPSFHMDYYGGNQDPGGDQQNHPPGLNRLLGVFDNPIYRYMGAVFGVANFDYVKSPQNVRPTSQSQVVRNLEVSKTFYVPNHTAVDVINNLYSEGCLTLQLKDPTIDNSTTNPFQTTGQAAPNATNKVNYTFLTSLMRRVDNVYFNFSQQQLASCGDMKPIPASPASGDWFGADTCLGFYGFTTYTGDVITRYNGVLPGTKFLGATPLTNVADQIGGRFTHYFLGEFSGNPQLRYEDITNTYSKFYPRSQGADILVKFLRSVEPNQIQYNPDYSKVADIRVPQPYDPYFKEVNNFPYRIARGGRAQAEARTDNWRAFLPLDYYESSKNFGPIINLANYDFRLLIHHEYYLRITKDRTTLNTSNLAVVLGSGDIFDIDPTTPVPYEHGFGGTNHNLACFTSPAGYVFLDADKDVGNMFLYDGKLKSINEGLVTFLRDNISLLDRNTFTGNGMYMTYDPKYRRIIVVVKNKKLPASLQANYAGELDMTTEQISTLTPGTSIVQYQGQYYTFTS